MHTLGSSPAGGLRSALCQSLQCAAGVLTVLALLVLIKHTDLPGGQVITIYGSKAVPPSYPNADLSPELRGLLAAVAINRTVVAAIASNISISDDPKFGTLHLLVESAQRANVSNLFVAAYDQVTLDWLVAHGVPALLRQMPTNCDKALHWVMCAKGDLARDVVALGYNLLALDTDVLFFRNPLEGGLDGSFDVESSSDAMNEKLQCSPFGSSRTASEEGYPYLQSMCIAQLNYGVVWYTASRRLADTLSALSEKVRGGPVWDQMVFAHMFTMPSSRVSPWSGRHTLRVMDPLVFPNTCNLNWLLTKQDIAKMRPVLLHFNCSPPESRRDIMMTVWQAFQQHRAYLMAARSCPTKAITCRPEHLNATKPSP